MKRIPLKNSLLLLLTALIWGTAFVAQRVGMDYIGPLTFNAVRSIIGGVVLVPVILVMNRFKTPEQKAQENPKTLILGGVCCGVLLCVASNLQQFGIKYTSVGKAGFITALYIILVPVFSIFLKRRAGVKIWVSVVISLVGLYLLCMTDSFSLSAGDTLVFLCAIAFTFHILVIDYFSPKVDGVKMSCIQFFVSGVISAVGMLLFEEPQLPAILDGYIPILYTGVLSCGVAYTLQIVGQKNMNPTVASLILSLESVISVIAAWLILNQELTAREVAGCILMFAAIILAQLPQRESKRTAQAARLDKKQKSA